MNDQLLTVLAFVGTSFFFVLTFLSVLESRKPKITKIIVGLFFLHTILSPFTDKPIEYVIFSFLLSLTLASFIIARTKRQIHH